MAMAPSDRSGAAGRALGAIKATSWTAKAKQAAATLKAEYEAGKQGDTTAATPIWSTPKEQLDALLALLRSSKATSESGSGADGATAGEHAVEDEPGRAPESVPAAPSDGAATADEMTAEADEVTRALRSVDWAGVRSATAERTSEATKAMREMAEQVDWARVQPVAARLSSALIAAVASGQVPIGGRLGSTVARAIADQSGLGQRVAQNLTDANVPLPPDFRGAIEATSREV